MNHDALPLSIEKARTDEIRDHCQGIRASKVYLDRRASPESNGQDIP
jgi:hypothetical protein